MAGRRRCKHTKFKGLGCRTHRSARHLLFLRGRISTGYSSKMQGCAHLVGKLHALFPLLESALDVLAGGCFWLLIWEYPEIPASVCMRHGKMAAHSQVEPVQKSEVPVSRKAKMNRRAAPRFHFGISGFSRRWGRPTNSSVNSPCAPSIGRGRAQKSEGKGLSRPNVCQSRPCSSREIQFKPN